MGDIVPFNRPRKQARPEVSRTDVIGEAEFTQRLIDNDESIRRVAQNIGILCRFEKFQLNDVWQLGSIRSNRPFGTLHPMKLSPQDKRIVTSSWVPDYLHRVHDLTPEEAVNLTVDYATAFAVVYAGVSRTKLNRAPQDGFNPEVWQADYCIPESGVKVASYRAAAQLALYETSFNLEAPELKPDKFFPPHISALYNPLPEDSVKVLHAVLKPPSQVQ